MYQLILPATWVPGDRFERCWRAQGEIPAGATHVTITLPAGCNMMVDAGIRLLSLANQLAHSGKQVTIEFEAGHEGVMGYFDRIGFFQLLHPSISILPPAPRLSSASIYGGSNPDVVEFKSICPSNRVGCRPLPGQLVASLQKACSGRSDCDSFTMAAYTVLSELIDNIFEHSDTVIDGYAALQVYRNAGHVTVAVSDSGHGILETLRPTLSGHRRQLSDADLIVKMLNEGLSRHGKERGCGLQNSAAHALKYKAELTVRLPDSSLRLVPSDGAYDAVTYAMRDLPKLRGTHFAYKIRLDTPLADLV